MRKFIACLLLGTLLGMISPLLSAQQNQNAQKSKTEIEALKKRVSELEKQLQSVENSEKMHLQAKLAEANAKLINAGVDKFKEELKDSNNKWLTGWSVLFLAVLSVVGAGFWSWLRSRADRLIADEVEKNLNGFKEAVGKLDILEDQQRILEKEHAASMLKSIIHVHTSGNLYPEKIEALREETLLQVFEDNNYHLELIHKAAEVLAARKCLGLVSPMLKLLNSFADSDSDIDYIGDQHNLRDCVTFLGLIETPDAHQALETFLHHLLTEDSKHKDLFLKQTVFVLATVSIKLGLRGSIPIVRKAIPHLKNLTQADFEDLSELAEYFDIFNEPKGVTDILINHREDGRPYMISFQKRLEDKCLELLEKHDPEFVKEWRKRETTTNSNV